MGCGEAGPVLLVVVGPTAVGKSDFALRVCERFGGEILSVDSMQVYRGLDRGTAKPDAATRRRVPHHGIDLADPGHDFSLGEFVRAAETAIAGIAGRGRLPVLVGGTGLYLRGLLKGIIDAPPRDESLRARMAQRARAHGPAYLHRLLQRVDAEAARRLPSNDRQKLVRALEVRFLARRGLSDIIRETPFGPDRYRSVKVGLSMNRQALYRRIDERVMSIFAAGLLDEIRRLRASGVPDGANALKALGYREALRHLRGEITLPQAIELAQRNTRRYAKRQWTWFRKETEIAWFELDPSREDRFREPMEHAARRLGRR